MTVKHLDNKELSRYLMGSASVAARGEIERHLKACSDCFQLYMNMREAAFLQKGSEQISPKMRAAVLQRIREGQQSHVSVIVRFLKDQVIVFSGDQDTLSYQGIKATYAFRDVENISMTPSREGPVSITRVINERELTLTIFPRPQADKVGLSVLIKPSEHLRATVSFEGEVCETIDDISRQSMLRSEFPKQGNLNITFARGEHTAFTVSLQLETG